MSPIGDDDEHSAKRCRLTPQDEEAASSTKYVPWTAAVRRPFSLVVIEP